MAGDKLNINFLQEAYTNVPTCKSEGSQTKDNVWQDHCAIKFFRRPKLSFIQRFGQKNGNLRKTRNCFKITSRLKKMKMSGCHRKAANSKMFLFLS